MRTLGHRQLREQVEYAFIYFWRREKTLKVILLEISGRCFFVAWWPFKCSQERPAQIDIRLSLSGTEKCLQIILFDHATILSLEAKILLQIMQNREFTRYLTRVISFSTSFYYFYFHFFIYHYFTATLLPLWL